MQQFLTVTFLFICHPSQCNSYDWSGYEVAAGWTQWLKVEFARGSMQKSFFEFSVSRDKPFTKALGFYRTMPMV